MLQTIVRWITLGDANKSRLKAPVAPSIPRAGFRWHDWLLVMCGVLVLKQLYSIATVDQLQWVLRPLVAVLEGLGGFAFEGLPSGEWLDQGHGVVIVKACVGGNFLLVSWLGYLWRWQHGTRKVLVILISFVAAWLTALFANALRITLLVHGQGPLASWLGLTTADSHRLIGIAVYFLCLWVQLARPGSCFKAFVTATVFYLGLNLMLPGIRAWALGLHPLDRHHVLWTAGVPIAALGLWGIWRIVRVAPACITARSRFATMRKAGRRLA